jgi:steroid 5-alpha reductase family enzyme
LIDSYWLLFVLGWAVAGTLLAGLYLLQRRTGDATAVDAGWAASLVLIAIVYAVFAPGKVEHRALIATMVVLENLRLAVVVLRRVGNGEDSRYQELRSRWRARGREQVSFAVFYQAQAALAAILSGPILLASFNRHDGLALVEWVGAALWLVAATGERTADRQLARFKADPANRGTTLRSGLWRYSRHPNYFFQWLTWCAYALVALAAPWGWIGLYAPALILCLIVFVTGIPPSEQAALRSRGDDFRRYQRETSAFIPWFPRSSTG